MVMMATGLWYPVYDRNLSWVGVRLETDAGDAGEVVSPAFFARTTADLQAIKAIGDRLLFVGADFLAAGDNLPPLPFPPSRLVIVLNDAPPPSEAAEGLCRAQCAQGARLAVTGLGDASRSGAKLFAHSIGSMAQFEQCVAQGFDYFTFGSFGYPENSAAAQDTSRMPLMRLLSLVTKDAETAEMEAVFKLEPKLAFDLLRLVNSTSFGLRTEITSFAQAILVLGRRQLQRWIQLLLFAHRSEGENSPNVLMQRAAGRGRMMELLALEGNERAEDQREKNTDGHLRDFVLLCSYP